jgi:cell division protein FtsB
MVIRRRVRAIVVPAVLWTVSALVEAKRVLKVEAYGLTQELNAAKAERATWEHRVSLLRSEQIDRDLLEERARVVLGRVHANDLVIIGP